MCGVRRSTVLILCTIMGTKLYVEIVSFKHSMCEISIREPNLSSRKKFSFINKERNEIENNECAYNIYLYNTLPKVNRERISKKFGRKPTSQKRLNVYFRIIFTNELFKLFQTGILMDGRLGRTPNEKHLFVSIIRVLASQFHAS